MNTNKDLQSARSNKADEFYTTYEDIEAEMNYYKHLFKRKKIHCPCDDARKSKFVRYFLDHCEEFNIRKFTSISYSDDPSNQPVLCVKELSMPSLTINCVKTNGSFDSEDGIDLIRRADIIVTNPPFSKFRQFMELLISMNKNFIILGNVNAITYREIFPYIVSKKIRLGPSIHSGDRKFFIPDDYPLDGTACGVDDDGNRYIRVKGVRWFTNMKFEHPGVNRTVLTKKYNPEEYPKYDTYDAINVNTTKDIPYDYDEKMGVPITVMDKMNENGYLEFLNENNEVLLYKVVGQLNSGNNKGCDFAKPIINGKCKFKRIVIKKADIKK